MKRFNRLISTVVALCFILNTACFDLAMAQTADSYNLATPSVFNNLIGLQPQDMGRIEAILRLNFTKAKYRNALDVDRLILIADQYRDSIYKTQVMFREIKELPNGYVAVMCKTRQEDFAHGAGRYYAVFQKEMKDAFSPIYIYTEAEFKRFEASGAFTKEPPKREAGDEKDRVNAKNIARYVRQEMGIDQLIAFAHSHESYKFDIRTISSDTIGVNYSKIVNEIVGLTKITVDNPGNLTPIQARECYIIPITRAVEAQLKECGIELESVSGEKRTVIPYYHSSNNAVHVFLAEDDVKTLETSQGGRIGVAASDRAKEILEKIRDHLTHEVGVMLGMPILGFDSSTPYNAMDQRYRAAIFTVSLEPKRFIITDLDQNLATRDYAGVNPEATFKVGGVNDSAVIRAMTSLNGLTIEELNQRLKPSDAIASSLEGFIGRDEDLISVLIADNDFVLQAGFTHQRLAEPLLLAANTQKPGKFEFQNIQYTVDWAPEASRGLQSSPFNDRVAGGGIMVIKRLTDSQEIKCSPLTVEYIKRYGFYQGKGTNFRTEPAQIIAMFFTQSSVPAKESAGDKPAVDVSATANTSMRQVMKVSAELDSGNDQIITRAWDSIIALKDNEVIHFVPVIPSLVRTVNDARAWEGMPSSRLAGIKAIKRMGIYAIGAIPLLDSISAERNKRGNNLICDTAKETADEIHQIAVSSFPLRKGSSLESRALSIGAHFRIQQMSRITRAWDDIIGLKEDEVGALAHIVPELVKSVEEARSERWKGMTSSRLAGIKALGKMGVYAIAAVPLLQKIMAEETHNELMVLDAAAEAITKILNAASVLAVTSTSETGSARQPAETVRIDEEIAAITSLATEAGRAIPTYSDSRYTLLVTEQFYSNGELDAHRALYGDRFSLDKVSGQTPEQFVANVLAKANGKESKTVVLVPDDLSALLLEKLTAAGIRFVRTNVTSLLKARSDKDPDRAKLQIDTYVTMLLVRHITKDMARDSSAYRVLSFYLKSHFNLENVTIDDYINAILNSEVAKLIKGYLSYRPITPYDARKDYEGVAKALISA